MTSETPDQLLQKYLVLPTYMNDIARSVEHEVTVMPVLNL